MKGKQRARSFLLSIAGTSLAVAGVFFVGCTDYSLAAAPVKTQRKTSHNTLALVPPPPPYAPPLWLYRSKQYPYLLGKSIHQQTAIAPLVSVHALIDGKAIISVPAHDAFGTSKDTLTVGPGDKVGPLTIVSIGSKSITLKEHGQHYIRWLGFVQ